MAAAVLQGRFFREEVVGGVIGFGELSLMLLSSWGVLLLGLPGLVGVG